MSRKFRTTLKSLVCFIAAFVISFNMVAVDAFTAHAEDNENAGGITDAAPIVVSMSGETLSAANTSVNNAVPETDTSSSGNTEQTTPAQPTTPAPTPEIQVIPAAQTQTQTSESTSGTTNNDAAASGTTEATTGATNNDAAASGTTEATTGTTNNGAAASGTTEATTGATNNDAAASGTTEATTGTTNNDAAASTGTTNTTNNAAEAPKPEVYTTTVDKYTYGSDNKSVVGVLFYHDSDTDISDLDVENFSLDNIDPTKYDVVYDPETGILAIAEKSSITHKAGSVSVAKEVSTIVYHDFVETFNVNSLDDGTLVYFVPHAYEKVLTYDDAILGIPTGTAVLTKSTSSSYGNNSYATNQIKAITNSTATQVNNVLVDQNKRGTGFDGCPAGTLYYFAEDSITKTLDGVSYENHEGYTSYWCCYGGVQLARGAYGHAYVFTQDSVNINSNTLLVNAKKDTNLPITGYTIQDSDLGKYLDLSLMVNGKEIDLAGCKVKDGYVNYLTGDSSIDLDIGGSTVTIQLDTTGLEQNVWIYNNSGIISKQTVTENDMAAIKEALTEGMVNVDIDGTEKEYVQLKDKFQASIWQENNKEAIHASENDYDKYYLVTETSQRYTETVSDRIKAYMDINLVATQAAMETNIKNEANSFVATNAKDTETNKVFDDVTADNTDQILAGEESYNSLHNVVKDFVNRQLTGSSETTAEEPVTYGVYVNKAKAIKTVADNFVETFASVLVNEDDEEKTKIIESDYSNYQQILNGEAAWNAMNDEQRKYANKKLAKTMVDPITEEEFVVSFEKLLEQAKAIRNRLIVPVVTRNFVADDVRHDEEEEIVVPVVAPKKVVKEVVEEIEEVAEEVATVRSNTSAAEEEEEAEEEELEKSKIKIEFEETADKVDAEVGGFKKQGFGLGQILINVQTYLENTEDGFGTYMQSRGKDKNELQHFENQLSYSLANADSLASYVLTDEELASVQDGDTMEIRLRITPNEKQIPMETYIEINAAIEKERQNIAGLKKGEYIDISLEKRKNQEEWSYVPNTNGAIKIDMDVPTEFLKSGRKYYVMRDHDGECTLLEDLDDDENTITIETDRFSNYIILYDDTYADAETVVESGVIENPTVAAITTAEPVKNMSGTAAAISFMFLLLIFAVVVYNARRENAR